MKPAYFVCLLLFITATIFVFGQSNNISLIERPPAGFAPSTTPSLNPKAKAAIAGGDAKLPSTFAIHRPPFSPRSTFSFALPRSIQPAGMQTASSASSSIFLEAPTYSSGAEFAYSVAVADINGDGKPDMVVANCASIDVCNTAADGAVSVLLGNGDGTFQAATSYNSGGMVAVSVAIADVNGDGKPDLVVANFCYTASNACFNGPQIGGVAVLLGNGNGTFQPAVSYGSGGYYASSVAVKDVNGDGKPDLLVANSCADDACSTTGSVSVLLGNGDGAFRAATTYGSGGQTASSVAVADVNGDGRPDLLVANENPSDGEFMPGEVGVLLGNGDGTFRAAVSYASGGYGAIWVVVGDVNGDGKPDLAVANVCADSMCLTTGAAGVLLGNGDGTFSAPVSYSSGGQFARSVVLGDINKDGQLDLLVANACGSLGFCDDGGAAVLLGNGNGKFQPAVSYDSGGYYAEAVAIADVNGDGKPDVLVADDCPDTNCDTTGLVGVLLGKGNGTLQSPADYDAGGGVELIADVNGDGKLDLLAVSPCATSGNCANGMVDVLLGNGNGTFQVANSFGSGGYYADSVAVGDVNGDGKPDLVVANQCVSSGNCVNGVVSVLLGQGNGTFQPAVSYGSGGQYPQSVVVADVNGDGKPDLIVANCGVSSSDCIYSPDGLVAVLLNNGDGTFQTALGYDSGGNYATSVAVADVNGDGKPDLVVANTCTFNNAYQCAAEGTLGVLLGKGDGTFQTAVLYDSGGYYASSVVVADVNGDGKPDLVVGNECGQLENGTSICEPTGTVAVLLGNGDGTFQAALNTITPTSPGQLALEDFNGDGRLDAFGNSQLLLGKGDGTFQTPMVLSPPYGGAAGDLNRDGKPDLAVGGVTVLLNVAANFKYATTTVVTSSLNPAPPGVPVTFTATVTPAFTKGALTGRVSFYDGTTLLGSGSLSQGKATLSKSSLTLGSHSITTRYAGGGNYLPSTSPILIQLIQGPMAELSPASLNFGNQPIGTKSLPQKITLSNKGNAALSITAIAVTGANAGDFTQTNTCGRSLAAGASCSIAVIFRPSVSGSLTADISLSDNAEGSPQKVTLSGTGTFIFVGPQHGP